MLGSDNHERMNDIFQKQNSEFGTIEILGVWLPFLKKKKIFMSY